MCPEAGCGLPIGGHQEYLMASNSRVSDTVTSFNLVDTLRLPWARPATTGARTLLLLSSLEVHCRLGPEPAYLLHALSYYLTRAETGDDNSHPFFISDNGGMFIQFR